MSNWHACPMRIHLCAEVIFLFWFVFTWGFPLDSAAIDNVTTRLWRPLSQANRLKSAVVRVSDLKEESVLMLNEYWHTGVAVFLFYFIITIRAVLQDDVIKWKHFPRFTGPLWGEFTGYRLIPVTKASDAEFWYFRWSAPWINCWVNNREASD